MRKKKPKIVSLDEVIITRGKTHATIEYKDTTISAVELELGPEVQQMSDEEILDKHNQTLSIMELMAASYEHVAVEIPPGQPQIRFNKECNQWVPRGDVLRCFIDDVDSICIDDQKLSLEEFGRLIGTHVGWGMRITFVPEDEVDERPQIEVQSR